MEPSPSPPASKMTSSTLYPKIGKLKDVLHELGKLEQTQTSLDLVGSVKLHGTHADIVFDAKNEMHFQSRNRRINLDMDNVGFAAWATPLRQRIFALKNAFVARYRALNPNIPLSPTHPVVIAGEWCGKGIQKKVALVDLPKQFVIVSVNINGWVPDEEYGDISDEAVGIYNISRAGFFHRRLDVEDSASLEAEINALVEKVEKECPYAKSHGVSGLGEGIVWKVREHAARSEFWFKSKGAEFVVTERTKIPKAGDHGRARSFAVAVVTNNRLEQGWDYLREMRVARDMRGMGEFLKWIMQDCVKEERREMEEANVKEQDLKSSIANIACPWYKGKVESTKQEDS